MSAHTTTKYEPDGSVTEWESHDNGRTWSMTSQTYPERKNVTSFCAEKLDIPSAVTEAEAAVLRHYAEGKTVLEVGALLGHSTVTLAQVARRVVSLDPHDGYPAANPRPTLDKFLANLWRYDVIQRVTPVLDADHALAFLRERQFDMAFIDTTGEFDDTYRIIHEVIPLLRHHAVLAVHDCGHPDWPGAMEAVQKFSDESGRPFDLTDRLAVFEGCWH